MSYYTKYRPQTIAELDLDSVRTGLSTILSSGKFAQVYLFCGPKGTGKTSSARILAKLLNCETNRQPPTADRQPLNEPCNHCDSCRRITSGHSLSCLELDAASNRGIDDIRQLKERVGLAPSEGRFTVYIVDEVHMLTTEAFNALLKTLEEPPAHAIFILCTTDPQKIPDTVLSRCMRVNFTKATPAEIIHSLNKAVAGESLQVTPDVLQVLAERVDGSFRDAMKLLEQMSLSSATITREMVDEITGYSEGYDPSVVLKALLDKDVQTVLSQLQQKQALGIDPYIFGRQLLERVRRQLIEALAQKNSTASDLIRLAASMNDAVVKIKTAAIPYLPLEIMTGEWCLGRNEASPSPHIPAYAGRQVPISKPAIVSKPTVKFSPPAEKPPEPKTEPPAPKIGAFSGSLEDVVKHWPAILTAVRPYNHSLEALLKSTKLTGLENGELTIEAFYKFHKEQLELDRHRRILEEVIAKICGGQVMLHFTIRQTAKPDASIDNVSGNVEDDALVKAAEEIFG